MPTIFSNAIGKMATKANSIVLTMNGGLTTAGAAKTATPLGSIKTPPNRNVIPLNGSSVLAKLNTTTLPSSAGPEWLVEMTSLVKKWKEPPISI